MRDNSIKLRGLRWATKRERWGLTLWGWVAVALAALLAGLICAIHINGFLAVSDPVKGDLLVMEGWIPDYAIPGAISEFEKNGYRQLISIGGPILLGSHLAEYQNYGELGRARVKALGFNGEQIVVLETQDIKKDRTYESAVTVKRWVVSSEVKVQKIDVYTLGAHARRSRLLFQKAFGDDAAIGVIAANDQTYDPYHWWRSSNGVRTVVSELIAYLYAVILFHP